MSSNIQPKQKARGNILWTAVRSPRPGWLSGLLATAGAYGHWVSFRNADRAAKRGRFVNTTASGEIYPTLLKTTPQDGKRLRGKCGCRL